MKPALKPATIFRTSLLLVSLVLLGACSGRTQYTIEYRALSNIPQEFVSRIVTLPVDSNQYLYLMPYAAVGDSSSSMDVVLQRGTELQYPVPDVPEGGNLKLSLEIGMDIHNLSTTTDLPEVSAQLYIAPPDSTNVYTEGIQVFTEPFSTGSILAGQTGRLSGTKYVAEGDPAWDILTNGDIRCGVKVTFTASASNTLDLSYILDTLQLRISTYPFGYLP